MDHNKGTILVVDDELMNINFLVTALQKKYLVYTSLNGADAIRQTKEYLPDLILLDVIMPGMNGFDVARAIKTDEALSDIPIIFLTVLDTFESETEGLSVGGIDYLPKPFNLKLLELRIRNHLELKRRNDKIREQKEELEASFARIKRLEGIIPICMHCKSIRNDETSWQQIEAYLVEHTDAQFSHGICPGCYDTHYLANWSP